MAEALYDIMILILLSEAVLQVMTAHQLDCTWFLFGKFENVSLRSPSASVPPAPESLSASPLLTEPDQRSPKRPASVRREEELKHTTAGDL